jgi:hypothetical protein
MGLVLKLFATGAPTHVRSSTPGGDAPFSGITPLRYCHFPLFVPTALFPLSSAHAGVRLSKCQNKKHEANIHASYFNSDAAFERNHAEVGRFVVHPHA